ncbi:hypothetical protein ACIHEI_37410 [Kitasatospora sp. NPDC051984]|uniref:hypothetical protein n=1 Tax=Kitasatospora sp. NPDC051984 TaxID=3364059 RepID=UPI0037C677F8
MKNSAVAKKTTAPGREQKSHAGIGGIGPIPYTGAEEPSEASLFGMLASYDRPARPARGPEGAGRAWERVWRALPRLLVVLVDTTPPPRRAPRWRTCA